MPTYVWANPVDGDFQTAANWTPSSQVPGLNDDVLITVAGAPYTVSFDQEAIVRSIGTTSNVTLDVRSGGSFWALVGTDSTSNAGTVKVEAGATFVVGHHFVQGSSSKIVASGSGATINLWTGGTIIGGPLLLENGALLRVEYNPGILRNVAVTNNATIHIDLADNLLLLDGVTIRGSGTIRIDSGAQLDIANSTIEGNDIQMAGEMRFAGDYVNKTSETLTLTNGKLLTRKRDAINFPDVTFTNDGTIISNGTIADGGVAVIGDAHLTLLNTGTIESVAGSAMQINAVGTFINKVGAQLLGHGSISAGKVDNFGTIKADGTGYIEVAGALMNAGTVTVHDGATFRGAGGLTNSGTVTVDNGATFDATGGIANTGTITASGPGTTMNLGSAGNTLTSS